MALVATVSKESVTQLTEDDFNITIHVKIVDEVNNVLLDKNYSERYYSELEVDTVKAKLQQQIIVDWNRIVTESAIYNATAFSNMVSEIQAAANSYIN